MEVQPTGSTPSPAPTAQIYAPGQLKGPRLQGRFVDGRSGEFPLGLKTTVGRHPNNVLRLVDREVSKDHAIIEKTGGYFLLKDLGSSNGTFVNSRKVKELRLKDGDRLMFGASEFTFLSGGADGLPGGTPGVTIVASAQSMPAFLAQIEQAKEKADFKPADQIRDDKQLRDDYEKLRIAHEFQTALGNRSDGDGLYEKILKVAFKLLRADNAVIFPTSEDGKLLPGEGGTPRSVILKTREQDNLEVSTTVLEKVSQTKKAVLIADANLDSRFSSTESIVSAGIRSAMAVPLLTEKGMKAILFCDTRKLGNAFTEKDLKLLSGIASQAAVALENAQLASKVNQEEKTREELARFLSPQVAAMVAARVAKGESDLSSAGELTEVTSLFVDIRGFTSMAEADSPQQTVAMLNTFFKAMAKAVFDNEGNLDKFIGDCVMAVWGPPSRHPDDAARALNAALQMQAAVEAINVQRAEDGLKPIEVGIGINTGDAIVGYMGSDERHEFTAIGDSVNTASRLCGLAKTKEILTTEFTVRRAQAAGARFLIEPVSVLHVKGKEKGVPTYRVLGRS